MGQNALFLAVLCCLLMSHFLLPFLKIPGHPWHEWIGLSWKKTPFFTYLSFSSYFRKITIWISCFAFWFCFKGKYALQGPGGAYVDVNVCPAIYLSGYVGSSDFVVHHRYTRFIIKLMNIHILRYLLYRFRRINDLLILEVNQCEWN